ncbi:hypothetical protein EIN_291620 [Entamoeba invadens IP1]|uniref:Uncharacterized protein n=1 Tax=Entamoeba invadens IP1 TaxID=370355 RepID=A0A0A1UAG5_ENTIV|nr:hypothetical protein EIN_291620 [Entamoeba invadens IP1]ELP92043.1 hypothetical protein EIN_291620 [Entamoeba invadens IP1]|eukprot:XP_004258814.1 hypothetical protein EIN_291620 [Entamoeba invadens IP1]
MFFGVAKQAISSHGSLTIEGRAIDTNSTVTEDGEVQSGLISWMRELSESDCRLRQALREEGDHREQTGVPITCHAKVLGAMESKATKNIIVASFKRSGVVGVNIGKIKRMFVSIKEASRLLQEANGVYTSEQLESFVLPPTSTYLVKMAEESLSWNIQELNQHREPLQTTILPPIVDPNEKKFPNTQVNPNIISSSDFMLRMNRYFYGL